MDSMNIFNSISTDRLLIRRLDTTYKNAFFEYRSLPEVYEYQTFKPLDTKEADGFISSVSEYPNIPNTWFQLAVCINNNNNKLIGDIGIHFLEDNDQIEIGYTIAPDFQGQGYAIEALRAVINYLFTDLRKHRIIASVDPNNIKSVKLLDKLGMRKEAHFIKSIKMSGVWLDDCIYAILNEEWDIQSN